VVPLAAIVGFVFATNVFLDEQTLTGEQEADRLPGRFAASVSRLDIPVPPGSNMATDVQNELAGAGSDAVVSLQSPDFPLYQLQSDGVYLREMPWQPEPFPEALRLTDGRFPEHAGEVAIVGKGLADGIRLGDRLDVLGQPDALEVVGIVENTLVDDGQVLAAPRTWAGLDVGSGGELSQLAASPTFFLPDQEDQRSDIDVITHALKRLDIPALRGVSEAAIAAGLTDAVRTRADARADTEPKWTSRSPLSFWVPALTLIPLGVLLAFWTSLRTTVPAMRGMTRQGVKTRIAAASVWLTILTWVVGTLVVSGTAGAGLGHLAAQLGAGTWSEPGATWRAPVAACAATVGSVLAGGCAGWLLLWVAVGRHSRAKRRRIRISGDLVRHVRHGVATLAGSVMIFTLFGLETPIDAMLLTALTALVVALLTPDLFAGCVARLPSGSLPSRLSARFLTSYLSRYGATTAVLVMVVALSSGFLISANSAYEADRAAQEPTALPGQVALDGDEASLFPVPESVVRVAESVPALAEQDPVQLYAVGELFRRRNPDIVDLRKTVTIPNNLGLAVAFETPEDVSRAVGRSLTPSERTTLSEGGLLVVDEQVTLGEGNTVDVVDRQSQAAIATVPALVAPIELTPWLEAVPAVMLTSTAADLGYPVSRGALIYTDVSTNDAAAVIDALSASGINPEYAEVYRDLPPVAPAGALIGSAVALFVLLLALAVSATRAQVLSMRPWASRLTQLGVKISWARRIMLHQYGVMLAVAVPLGLLAGVAPLLTARAMVPEMVIAVPWSVIVTAMAALVSAVAAAAWLGSRAIGSRYALGWQDLEE
jgi:hypothetical protein